MDGKRKVLPRNQCPRCKRQNPNTREFDVALETWRTERTIATKQKLYVASCRLRRFLNNIIQAYEDNLK